MINDKDEKKVIIKQLTAVNNELVMIKANITILHNYFETLIDSYKDENYIK